MRQQGDADAELTDLRGSLIDATGDIAPMQVESEAKTANARADNDDLVHSSFRNGAIKHNPNADRKSTRLNSSHSQISYAVFCLKKKKTPQTIGPCPARHQTCPYS